MAGDTKFKCNSNQYDVGLTVAKNISDSMVSYKDSITSAFNNLKSVAETYKIDLTSSIDLENINGDFILVDDCINDISNIANTVQYLAAEYSDNPESFMLFYQQTLDGNNFIDSGKKILATIAMGGAKFGEGFGEFFEDIGDGAIILGSGIASIFGQNDLAKSWRGFAAKDVVANAIENNNNFEVINKYSYFDKNSIYADVFKFGGKVVAGIATGKVASGVFSGISGAKNVEMSAETVEKVSKYSAKIANTSNSFGRNARDSLSKGYGLGDSLTFAAGSGITDFAIDKISPKLSDTLESETKLGDVKQAVKTFTSQRGIFKNDEVKEATKKASGKLTDFVSSELQKGTELDDQNYNEGKNKSIKAVNSVGKELGGLK